MAEEAKTTAIENPMETTEVTDIDKQFQQGVLLASGGKHDEATDIFGGVLSGMVEEHGELHEKCAKYYIAYGESLLNTVVKSGSSLGSKLLSADMADPEDHTRDDLLDSLASNQEDLELSWELFETARVILEKSPTTKENKLGLASVHMLTAKLLMENDKFADAVEELKQCITIRKQTLPAHHELLSNVYSLMAEAYTFAEDYKEAKKWFKLVLECLTKQLMEKCAELTGKEASGKSTVEDSTIKDAELAKILEQDPEKKKEIEAIQNLKAVITAVQEKVQDTELVVPATDDDEKIAAPTTIGFGTAPKTSSSQVFLTPVVKSAASSSSSSSSSSSKPTSEPQQVDKMETDATTSSSSSSSSSSAGKIHSPAVKRKIVPQQVVPASPEKKSKSSV